MSSDDFSPEKLELRRHQADAARQTDGPAVKMAAQHQVRAPVCRRFQEHRGVHEENVELLRICRPDPGSNVGSFHPGRKELCIVIFRDRESGNTDFRIQIRTAVRKMPDAAGRQLFPQTVVQIQVPPPVAAKPGLMVSVPVKDRIFRRKPLRQSDRPADIRRLFDGHHIPADQHCIRVQFPDPLQQFLIVLSELAVMKICEKHQPPCTSVKLRAPDHILRDGQCLPLPGRLKKACREGSRSGRTDAKQRRLTEAGVA